MSALQEVTVASFSPERFEALLGDRWEEVDEAIDEARRLLKGRVVWHVNSTARGGGVAELLQSLLAYARGAGVDVRWMTISGNPDFFRITKRIHNNLHESKGDGGPLGPDEREIYEAALAEAADELVQLVQPGDVVYIHDPQPAGLVPDVVASDVRVIWRCHIGVDRPGELSRAAWDFMRPYVTDADAYVFSRERFVWEGLDKERVWIVPPSIDAFSPKNQDLDPEAVAAILAVIGLQDSGDVGHALFPPLRRQRGSSHSPRGPDPGRARSPQDAPLVTQVSRWDRLKDPVGVLRSFAEYMARRRLPSAPRRSLGGRRLGRPGGSRGARRRHLPSRSASRREASPRPSRLPAHGRQRGERGNGERDPAALRRGRAEEPGGGLRAHRRRGDVEIEADGGQPSRRDPGSDRGRRLRGPDRRPRRPGGRSPRGRRLHLRPGAGRRVREGGPPARPRRLPRDPQPGRSTCT